MAAIFRKILCPVDFDENSMAALKMACQVAAQNEAPLSLMHVVPLPAAAPEIGALPSETVPLWVDEAKAKLEQIAREKIPSAIRSEIVARIGIPTETIVTAAAELGADLIVMATHGRSRSALGHLFLGSVAERVVRESVCPVLVVPPRQGNQT